MNSTESLGWALVHFLWQGALIAAAYSLVSAGLRGTGTKTRANARYLAGCLALVAMAAAPVITYLSRQTRPAAAAAVQIDAAGVQHTQIAAAGRTHVQSVSHRVQDYFPAVIALWLTGVTLLSSWSATAWLATLRLRRRGACLPPEAWRQKMETLALRMGVTQRVRLLESTLVRVPSVMGALRPVILMPASALLNLAPQQLEALLAHELAHIRRHDYLVNLVQTAIETLLFYHPAVWWVSRRVRQEREHCCDDLAVAACGDVLIYARALTGLEEIRAGYVLAASGGSLASRIRRLAGHEAVRRGRAGWLLLTVPLVLGLSMFARPPLPQDSDRKPAAQKTQPAPAAQRAQKVQPPAAVAKAAIPVPAATPASAIVPAARPNGFLAALSAAGYGDLSVDEIIDLKNHGVSGDYVLDMKDSGWARLPAKDLMHLRQRGVAPQYARAMHDSGIRDLNVRDLAQLRDRQVNAEQIREIHALGFGPYNVRETIDLFSNGVRPGLFHALKEAGFSQIGAREAIDLNRHGLSAADLREARKFNKRLSPDEVLKLKRAGVL